MGSNPSFAIHVHLCPLLQAGVTIGSTHQGSVTVPIGSHVESVISSGVGIVAIVISIRKELSFEASHQEWVGGNRDHHLRLHHFQPLLGVFGEPMGPGAQTWPRPARHCSGGGGERGGGGGLALSAGATESTARKCRPDLETRGESSEVLELTPRFGYLEPTLCDFQLNAPQNWGTRETWDSVLIRTHNSNSYSV